MSQMFCTVIGVKNFQKCSTIGCLLYSRQGARGLQFSGEQTHVPQISALSDLKVQREDGHYSLLSLQK